MKIYLFFLTVLVTASSFATEYRWTEIYKYPNSDWYSSPSDKLKNWLDEQDTKKRDYLDGLSTKDVEEKISDFWQEERILKRLNFSNWSIDLVLTEGAYSYEVRLNIPDMPSRKIIDSNEYDWLHAFEIYSNYTIRNISFGPYKRHLVVEIAKGRRTTYSDYLIYDLRDLNKPPKHIKDAHSSLLAWLGPQRIYYRNGHHFNLSFQLDLSSGMHQFFPSYKGNPKSLNGLPLSYELRPSYNDGVYELKFVANYTGSDKFSEIDLTEVTRDFPGSYYRMTVQSFDNDSLLIGNSGRNDEALLFLPFEIGEEFNVELKTPSVFKFPKGGSVQKVHKLGSGHYLAVYLSGVKKHYFILDENGNLVKEIEAPHARVRKIKSLENDNFEFTFESEVVYKKTFTFNGLKLDNFSAVEVDEQMYTNQEGERFKVEFFESKSLDGTKIPLKIVLKEDLQPNRDTPVYMNAYGGHGMVTYMIPSFEVGLYQFIKAGGVYATPAIRGGGEFGNDWYTPVFGTLVRYEDTESAIRELHSREIGSPETTSFEGWSNGGLLAGVMLGRAPELFKLVIPGNGLHDMERKDVLDSPFAWSDEFGSGNSAEGVEYLRSYSPVYNVKKKRDYPTVYVMVGDNDIRVNPSQSYKLTAVLQDFQTGVNPIIMDRYPSMGHWITKPNYSNRTGVTASQRKWKVIFNELGVE